MKIDIYNNYRFGLTIKEAKTIVLDDKYTFFYVPEQYENEYGQRKLVRGDL